MMWFVSRGEVGGDGQFSLEEKLREFSVDVCGCCCVSLLSRRLEEGLTAEFGRDIVPIVRVTTGYASVRTF